MTLLRWVWRGPVYSSVVLAAFVLGAFGVAHGHHASMARWLAEPAIVAVAVRAVAWSESRKGRGKADVSVVIAMAAMIAFAVFYFWSSRYEAPSAPAYSDEIQS